MVGGKMEGKRKIQEFFNLEENQDYFRYATTPKSCGGGDEFKLLALLGDRVLNLELYEILTNEGIIDSGSLTQRLSNYIHNEDILNTVGKILKIDRIMTPMDIHHQITKDELKESVEALIGANFKAHGYGPHKELIKDLYEIIKNIENEILSDKRLQLLYENPKGKLLELFQEFGFALPIFNTQRVGGSDDSPLHECTLTGRFFDQEVNQISDLFSSKKDAEKDAAVNFLIGIDGDRDFRSVKPKETCVYKLESISHNFIPDEIILSKMSGLSENVNLNSLTNESLYEWAKRKANKDPFRMLILLALRIDNLSGISWHAALPNGNIVFTVNNFDEKDYYEIGFGQSKTKAKKNVARKFIKDSNLFEWLKANYNNKEI